MTTRCHTLRPSLRYPSPEGTHTSRKQPDKPMNDQILDQIFLGAVGFAASLITIVNVATGLDVPITQADTMRAVRIMSHDVDMLQDTYLLTVVILGSLAGGAISYMSFPLPTPKAMAFKFLTSGLAGIVFSPVIATLLTTYLDLEMTGMFALAVSAVVAVCSWSVIQIAEPFAAKIVAWWMGTKLKNTSNE